MLQQLVHALVASENEAADDVLLEALDLGTQREQAMCLSALFARKTNRGLGGIIERYDKLPQPLQLLVLREIRIFHHALADAARADQPARRLAAMRLIALGRQGRLTYALSDSLHSPDETLSRGAVEALVALARWVATETRRLQRTPAAEHEAALAAPADKPADPADAPGLKAAYDLLVEQRGDIEQAVARAMDVHRSAHAQDVVRAGLLLADWPGSKTLSILQTARHGGQSLLVRRLQQPPESEHVEAFLCGAAHAGLRSHFGVAFAHIQEAPALDAVLRRTHWLKNHQLQLCMHQVARGAWWDEAELMRDLARRDPADAGKIGQWLAVSGIHDVVQDERMVQLLEHGASSIDTRLRLLRIAMGRPRGASVSLIRSLLKDDDQRLARMAAREIVRRRPADFENTLLQLMVNAPPSVRRVIGRCVGQAGFEQFWQRWDRMDRATRRSAGRAMVKILPDAVARLGRRLQAGPVSQQIKAIQISQELGLVDALGPSIQALCQAPHPRVRSKAVAAMADMAAVPSAVLVDRLLSDTDGRVRSNAIEVLESRRETEYVPVLAQRARSAHNRERANAIKALHKMKVTTATSQLSTMLADQRPEHRISAMWTLKQIGFWKLLGDVAQLAKGDPNLRVRRYAMGVLKEVAELMSPARQAG